MKNLSLYLLLLISIAQINCSSNLDCQRSLNRKVRGTLPIFNTQLINGVSLKIGDRFSLDCAFLHSRSVISEFEPGSVQRDSIFIKLKKVNNLHFKNGDTLSLTFFDNKYKFWRFSEPARIKKVNLLIKIAIEPCDSVTQILYEGLSGNIDRVAKGDVNRAELFDTVLNNKIIRYLDSLDDKGKSKIDSCSKAIKLLDWVQTKDTAAFGNKDYHLKPGIRKYLDAIASIVAGKIKSQKWELKKYVLSCVGFANEQKIEDPIMTILFDNADFSTWYPIIYFDNNGLRQDESSFLLDSVYPKKLIMKKIEDNYELSVARGYAAARYLKTQIKRLSNENIDIKYAGGGELPGRTDEKLIQNRRIKVQMELRAAK